MASAAKINWTPLGIAAATYLAVWGGAVLYLARTGGGWTDAVTVFVIFGVTLSGLAWLLTLGVQAPAIPVARPALESGVLLVYLALYAVVFLVFGMSWARYVLPPGREQELLVLALKLIVHVGLPCILLGLLGAKLRPLFQAGLKGRKFWRTLIVLGVVFLALLSAISPSLQQIANQHPSAALLAWAAPASFVWIALEAGLNEEFLYRAVLQTRLAALLRSPAAGVAVTALLFGLAHAPGLYLRGGPGVDGWSHDPLQVAAYTIATLSPMGVLFGVIYMRTKSLLLAVLLHGLVDVLPNLASFIQVWG
ncbi:MAG: CPBP family intramembrane metalloprotease [Proteobacteria bacterium]|nr:CPBP family intramembrane metalloprotease [Pseudomonadota bacterium]